MSGKPQKSDNDPDVMLVNEMSRFFSDPLAFVLYSFPWMSDKSLQLVELRGKWATKYPNCKYGPDEWACGLLDEIGERVKKNAFDGKNPVDALRVSVTSGHGIGKSALTSWLILWIMSTRPHAQGTVTANTSPQLQTKTWAQLAKWKNLCITSKWFEINTGRGNMKMVNVHHPDTWFCSGQTCREENSESFAGQHAASSTSFYIFDESSAIPDKIREVAEGGMTDGEPMMFAFGNPTRNTGWFCDTFRKSKQWWITRQVDSRDVQITNKEQFKQWALEHGEESDFFKVRVRGIPPSSSSNQLISLDLAESASRREIGKNTYAHAPVILGVDPAWTGGDRTCIVMRQGLFSTKLREWRGNGDDVMKAGVISQLWDEYDVDTCFIDIGWGTGIISILRSLGRNPIPVNFGAQANKPAEYLNKRIEMWDEMRKWLISGGKIDNDRDLIDDLTSPDYFFTTSGKKQLESKDDMRSRGLQSPDIADGLALTFAMPVNSKKRGGLDFSRLSRSNSSGMSVVSDNVLDD